MNLARSRKWRQIGETVSPLAAGRLELTDTMSGKRVPAFVSVSASASAANPLPSQSWWRGTGQQRGDRQLAASYSPRALIPRQARQ